MSNTASIAALACLALCGCRQRQHVSKANIEVVQRALANATESDTHFVHLKLTPGGKRAAAVAALPSPSKAIGSDAIITAKEVESVLGPPHEVYPPETALRDVEVFRYYYYQDKDKEQAHADAGQAQPAPLDLYEFNFHDGRLIEINLLPPGSSAKKS